VEELVRKQVIGRVKRSRKTATASGKRNKRELTVNPSPYP